MRWATFIKGRTPRRAAALAVLVLCSLALLLGSLTSPVAAEPAGVHHRDVASPTLVVVEADRSAPAHPCKRGAMSAPTGACATSGFAAGLSVVLAEHVAATQTGSRFIPAQIDLAQQWRGFPPDRPPRS